MKERLDSIALDIDNGGGVAANTGQQLVFLLMRLFPTQIIVLMAVSTKE
jgi:hypothetical protein